MNLGDVYVSCVFFVGGALFAQFNAFDRFLMLVGVVVTSYTGYEIIAGHGWGASFVHAIVALICIQLGYVLGVAVLHFRSRPAPDAPSVKQPISISEASPEGQQDVVRFHDPAARNKSQPGTARGQAGDV